MKDQGSVYQRMHCPCIYYLILFQCDIFQITYNSHIHNITVRFPLSVHFYAPATSGLS